MRRRRKPPDPFGVEDEHFVQTDLPRDAVDAVLRDRLLDDLGELLDPDAPKAEAEEVTQLHDELAVEYELIAANPASGRRRRLKTSKPRRGFVQPEQLMALLRAAEGDGKSRGRVGQGLLYGRGRPLLATLAGAGLRIGEALALERRHVNLARGELVVVESKTDAGRNRVVDLTPALREELALWLDRSPWKAPTDLVFATAKGGPDNRQNVRQRLLVPAIERANRSLAKEGIDPLEGVGVHGLRRTFATLRCAVGDDPVYIAAQIGHVSASFTLSVYAGATRRRERLSKSERRAYDEAVAWAGHGSVPEALEPAQWALPGTTGAFAAPAALAEDGSENEKAPR